MYNSLEHFKGLLRMSEDRTSATFGASTSVDDIIKTLGAEDLMMPCSPGVIGSIPLPITLFLHFKQLNHPN
jgi:hypothetical protein